MVLPRKGECPPEKLGDARVRGPWAHTVWGMESVAQRKASRLKMPSAQQVASQVKTYSEGKVPAKDFFAEDVLYSEPFFKVNDVEVLSLLFGLVWVMVSDVRYNVLSCFRTKEGIFVIEAEVTYTWRLPISLKMATSSVHFYNTVCVRPLPSGKWECTSLETVRESYMLSIPARIVTTPVIALLTAGVKVMRAVSGVFSLSA